MNKKIRVLVCEPEHAPHVEMMDRGIETLQSKVGGLIQAIYPHDDDTAIICNDEGKLMNMKPNRPLADDNGDIYDIVAGTFIIVRAPEDSDDFESLTDEQVVEYMIKYMPALFIGVRDGEPGVALALPPDMPDALMYLDEHYGKASA